MTAVLLAQPYDHHADECARAAERHRAMLIKHISEWPLAQQMATGLERAALMQRGHTLSPTDVQR
jgi:hypothetical protein